MAAVNVFVARDGNGFMRDIASWLVDAARATGRRASLIDDRLPIDDSASNFVVAPHEFFLLTRNADGSELSDAQIRSAARCSIPICTEQPGTPWFQLALGFCVGSPLIVDINATGVAAIEEHGFTATRLALGGVPAMVAAPPPAGRDIDVLFLGGHTDRRAARLAALAPALWDRQADIRLFTFARPVTGAEPGVLFGADKYELLARSKVLVNLHRSDDGDGYFEWARMVEAMANGCAVVTEPSLGHRPLEAGVHFVECAAEQMPRELTVLLDDESRRSAIGEAGRRAVVDTWPLTDSFGRLLDRVEAGLDVKRPKRSARRAPIRRGHAPPLLPVFAPHRRIRRTIYDRLIAEMHHRREIGRLRCLLTHGAEDHADHVTSPTYQAATPSVTVIVTVYDYAHVVRETLDSIVASEGFEPGAIELVIVDDHSTDDGRQVVESFIADHPDVPILLIASSVNRGLPASRNDAFARARADRVMVMDADNLVYPNCLRRLSDALDADPGAAFAYATLEAFGTTPGLASARGWHVPWLCDANYIDAQAMVRRTTWERHDGYRVDDDVHGWEDWDLWLRLAAAGEYGVHLPQMLGRYRTQESSMISITNLAADDLRAALVARYPSLPWPELDPRPTGSS